MPVKKTPRTAAAARAVIGVAALAAAATLAPGASAARQQAGRQHAAAAVAPVSGFPGVRPACDAPVRGSQADCLALVRTTSGGQVLRAAPRASGGTQAGYGPADLQAAYRLPSRTQGRGRTVAIVDAFDDPNAASDLATYRSEFGLPPCTSADGCFQQVNQQGAPSPLPPSDPGWAVEESLDIDMVSAVCPNCHILLVEADDNSLDNLAAAVDEAAALGADAISNSYGTFGGEFAGELAYDLHYLHPGVAVTAAAGDDAYCGYVPYQGGTGQCGPTFPAASRYVTAVGGTTLTRAAGPRGWQETAWVGTGSGCSAYEPKPSWQAGGICGMRTGNDVSAVADPSTGVAVYDTFTLPGWVIAGGTSVAAPVIASVYALAGNTGQTAGSANLYSAPRTAFFDITQGSNGACGAPLCQAGPGWDGPTGLGTPDGTKGF